MAEIKVYKNNELVNEFTLNENHECVLGRSSSCDIVLDNESGISRQHIRIYFNGDWQIENLSRYGGLNFEQNEIDSHTVKTNSTFSLSNYEIHFIVSEEDEGLESYEVIEEANEYSPQIETSTETLQTVDNSSFNDLDNDTATGVDDIFEVFLKIKDENGEIDEILRLDGDIWVVGRSSKCEIFIDNPSISREHFNITRTDQGYVITDLNSSHGTYVNGQKISEGQSKTLDSGDLITIKSINIEFEIRNSVFDSEVNKIDDSLLNLPQLSNNQEQPINPMIHSKGVPSVVKMEPKLTPVQKVILEAKKNKVRAALVVLIPFLFIGLFTGDKKKTVKVDKNQPSQAQVKQLEDMLKLAKNYYTTGKYELCIDQINKVNKVHPSYKDSKEIETYCRQAQVRIEKERDELEKIKFEREIKRKVSYIYQKCQEKINSFKTVAEVETCIAPGIELDPANMDLQSLKELVENKIRQQQLNASNRAAYQRRKRSMERQYKQALNLQKRGKHKQALKILNALRKKGFNKPNLNRTIASVSSKHNEVIEVGLVRCKEAMKAKKYKDAYYACSKVLNYDSTQTTAKGLRQRAVKSLSNDMKSIYQDAILEESMGNLEAAKSKWKEVADKSFKKEPYYKKSIKKLRRYNEGL